MPLRIAVQMDPVEHVDPDTDTTFALLEAAQMRGMSLWTYTPDMLSWEGGRLTACARPTQVMREGGEHALLGPSEILDLEADINVVLMRQDPPFDMAYITAAHLLSCIHPKTLVVNDPFWVRESPEKIFPLDFYDLMPPTCITRDMSHLEAFHRHYGDIILKPLYGNGGAGVFRLQSGDSNFQPLLEMFFAQSREPVMAQAYLPAIRQGDKRILLIDGEAVGAINRLPPEGETRSNLHVGGQAQPVELDEEDRRICARLGPVLKERGLILVGLDVIGGKLTEINVTSPTGVQELKRFSGTDAASLMWDVLEDKAGKA